MKFVSNRDFVHSSILGHAIEFKKGEPTVVPRALHAEVMEKGCVPVEDDGDAIDPAKSPVEGPAGPKLAPDDGDVRAEEIEKVIKGIVDRNAPEDFTGGGMPAAGAVTAALGWRVDQKEVRRVWEKVRPELLAAKA